MAQISSKEKPTIANPPAAAVEGMLIIIALFSDEKDEEKKLKSIANPFTAENRQRYKTLLN